MKRSTLSLLLTIIILVIGGGALWLLLIAPRLGLFPYIPKKLPVISATSTPETANNSALNLYVAAPPGLPNGAQRAELTLVKATVTDADGRSAVFFQGVQRTMLQAGFAQEALSERIPAGRWTKLSLDFSPAAELAYADGTVKAVLLGKKRAEFGFDAKVGVSQSLAVLAIMPFESAVVGADKALIANLAATPRTAETYVFGGFMLEPRDRGEILAIDQPKLVSVIKKDFGFDISVVKPGSSGFQPADGAPNATK